MATMTTAEFDGWQGYELLEPFGFPADERRHARRCAIAARAKAADFYYRPPIARVLTAEEVHARVLATGELGKKHSRRKPRR